MGIRTIRDSNTLTSKQLRRARRLYVFLCREYLDFYRDPAFDYVAKRMRESGMYSANVPERNTRQGIQSYLYRIDNAKRKYGELCGGFGWHEWCFQKGYDPFTGYSKTIMQQRA